MLLMKEATEAPLSRSTLRRFMSYSSVVLLLACRARSCTSERGIPWPSARVAPIATATAGWSGSGRHRGTRTLRPGFRDVAGAGVGQTRSRRWGARSWRVGTGPRFRRRRRRTAAQQSGHQDCCERCPSHEGTVRPPCGCRGPGSQEPLPAHDRYAPLAFTSPAATSASTAVPFRSVRLSSCHLVALRCRRA
jgi:hypothetical protein